MEHQSGTEMIARRPPSELSAKRDIAAVAFGNIASNG
jgi:hypothetical protein